MLKVTKFFLFWVMSLSPAYAVNFGSFNIRYDNPGDVAKGDDWVKRAPVIAQMVRFHDFHVIGTQEGLAHQVKKLNELMPEYTHVGNGRQDGKEGGEYAAIFYRTNRFALLDKGQFWLSDTPEMPSIGWDSKMRRICTWVKLQEVATRKTFFFFNTHFDHQGAEARKRSAVLIVNMIQRIAGRSPAVLTGDFNADQNSEIYDLLGKRNSLLSDSHEKAEVRLDNSGTTNGFHLATASMRRIDHIFVTNHFKVIRYGVLTDTYLSEKKVAPPQQGETTLSSLNHQKIYERRMISDHFPILIGTSF